MNQKLLYEGVQVDIVKTSVNTFKINIFKDIEKESILEIENQDISLYDTKELGKELDMISINIKDKKDNEFIKIIKKFKEDYDKSHNIENSDYIEETYENAFEEGMNIVKESYKKIKNTNLENFYENSKYLFDELNSILHINKMKESERNKLFSLIKDNYKEYISNIDGIVNNEIGINKIEGFDIVPVIENFEFRIGIFHLYIKEIDKKIKVEINRNIWKDEDLDFFLNQIPDFIKKIGESKNEFDKFSAINVLTKRTRLGNRKELFNKRMNINKKKIDINDIVSTFYYIENDKENIETKFEKSIQENIDGIKKCGKMKTIEVDGIDKYGLNIVFDGEKGKKEIMIPILRKVESTIGFKDNEEFIEISICGEKIKIDERYFFNYSQ